MTGISKDSIVDNGKTLLLKCLADGQPAPQIEWEAPNNDIYRLQSDEFEGIRDEHFAIFKNRFFAITSRILTILMEQI